MLDFTFLTDEFLYSTHVSNEEKIVTMLYLNILSANTVPSGLEGGYIPSKKGHFIPKNQLYPLEILNGFQWIASNDVCMCNIEKAFASFKECPTRFSVYHA